jgi:broad specificity phosphatase PhoE
VFCVTLPCHALNGLVDLPLTHPLRNNYYLVRAGESIADARGTVESNPVDKTSVAKSGLTARGAQQARAAADQLVQQLGFCQKTAQCWIWPSMTLNAYETGEIIGDKALLGHERIVPEFSYLDKRGFGAFNGASTREVMPQVHAQDRMNAQRRPPPGDDGTPPESIFDVFIRVRQLLSKLETQYGTQGADVVIVAPDTYPLSILECMLNGEPLEHFDQHLYAPGEVHRVPNPKVFPILESSRPHEQVNWANIQRVRQTTTSGN